MVKSITNELRAVAQQATRVAAECSDLNLSNALEGLAVNLMAWAADLERRFDQ
jgi:hypothetical protein